MKPLLFTVSCALLALPCPAPACTLCGDRFRDQPPLRAELASARVVVAGAITDSRMEPQTGMTGKGTSDLTISRVFKDDPLLTDKKKVIIERYLPIFDPKQPPRFVIFGKAKGAQLDFYHGRAINSDALLPYLDGVAKLNGLDQTKALLYYFDFLDHADETIAADAFLEFARSSDKDVGEVAKKLPAARLRKLLENPKTPSERLGLFAFLLSAAGGDTDADFLKKLIERPDERTANALDGLLCGYINLRPREGWDLIRTIVGDEKRNFNQRFAATRALRFYQGWKPAETRAEVLRCIRVMLPDGAVADLAIDDLRKWQEWELTAQVLGQYGKKTHDTPIVRRTIARYALSCPRPEAKQFVADLERRDPELVRELREALEFEKGR